MDPLAAFSARTRAWFEDAFREPTPAQTLGWPAIATGRHTLIQAPTGSGKTLAAFLFALDRLTQTTGTGVRLLYVSPLKALNYDIERNLRGPLAGLRSELRVGVRTGDTPQKERAAMLREQLLLLGRPPSADTILALPFDGLQFTRDPEAALAHVQQAVQRAARQGADSVILGGSVLAGCGERLASPVPLVDPLGAALRSLAALG